VAKGASSKRNCGLSEAKKRLLDARQFLEAAEFVESSDVVATNAIHSAIAAADALTCFSLGERSNDGNHKSAVTLLRKVDAKSATLLKRALDLKTKAGYESEDISIADAKACIRRATSLISVAERKLR